MTARARLDAVYAPWAEATPDRLALVDAKGRWTFRQLADAVDDARDLLRAHGVDGGDRVLIVAENSRAVAALLFACARLDAWAILVNARLSDREVDEIVAHAGPRVIAYATAASTQARAHAERLGATAIERPALGMLALGSADASATREPVAADAAEQVAVLVYTSGSSGQPKGVMLTHANLLFMAEASGAVRRLTQDDRLYAVLPISHIVGLAVVLLGGLMHGASVWLASRFNPAEMIASVERDGLTIMLGAPAMMALLLDYAARKGIASLRLPSLRIVSVSGAPLDLAVKQATERLLGLPLHHGYGITECAPTIAQIRPEAPRADCSVGPLLPGVRARLLDPAGAPVAQGAVGELWVGGPNVMRGYYKDAAATAEVVDAAGWFNTRDLARFEGDDLFIVGRTKELVIRSGYNVYPAEVEAVLNACPGVRQSAVVGRRSGADEEIVAFVEPIAGAALTAQTLARHAADHLTSYKQPNDYIVVTEMPMTSNGKIAKRALLESLAA